MGPMGGREEGGGQPWQPFRPLEAGPSPPPQGRYEMLRSELTQLPPNTSNIAAMHHSTLMPNGVTPSIPSKCLTLP